jgi:hypothetical protein
MTVQQQPVDLTELNHIEELEQIIAPQSSAGALG